MNNENKHSKSDRPLIGQKLPPRQNGNIFNLVGIVARTLKKYGHPTDVFEITERLFKSKSYEEALNIIGEYVEKENINTLETETEMMLTIMSCFAQAESESISKNVSWGIRQSFKNGNVPMQYARLLGYRKGTDGNAEIVPDEAEVVKEIFR